MSSRRSAAFSWSVGVLLVICASTALARPIENVFFGNPRRFRKPAELKSAKILQVIPEWQELRRKKLERTDPRYWILLDKVQRTFMDAIKDVAKRYGYDLVGEKGFLRGHEAEKRFKVADITLVVLDEIQRKTGTR